MRQSISVRSELSAIPSRMIVKLGSECVTATTGGIDRDKINRIVDDVASLRKQGIQTIVISSGAVHTGRGLLGVSKEEGRHDMSFLQALSALGQPELMAAYIEAFHRHGLLCAQILLTHEDFRSRERFFNAEKTIAKLLDHGVVPIINENDTVSFSEITVGDNDQLAVATAQMVSASLVVLLTQTDGLYDRDPSLPGAIPIPFVGAGDLDQVLSGLRLSGKSGAGRGGMRTKCEAVRKSVSSGIPVVIASIQHSSPLLRSVMESVGTFFASQPKGESTDRKAWLFASVKNGAIIRIDDGAKNALARGASLLAIGIRDVKGPFRRGDSVAIMWKRKIVAAGMSEYDSKDIRKVAGKPTSEIETILGHCHSEEIIHRDNLAVKGDA